MATHLDKEHRHNHFVINSVSFIDGIKFNDNKAAYRLFRTTSDELCAAHELSVIEHPKGRTPRSIYFAEKNEEPTKYNLMRQAIDKAISMSTNQRMFESSLARMGYEIDASSRRKHPVIRSIYGGRPTRLYHLGEDYMPRRIIERVNENDSLAHQNYHQFMHDTGIRIRPTRIRTHSMRPKQKITGLFALYLHYLYLLGYRPKRQNYRPLTPEMKEAIRRCEQYSRQARLLAREHLSTESDVQNFMEKTDEKIASLCAAKQKISNKLRRCRDPEQIEQLKQQRKELTAQIKPLRDDRKTAGQILDRAEQIRADIARENAAREQQRQSLQRECSREKIHER